MRILYISSSQVPSRAANSIHVMKMCQAFTRLGHEVQLVCWTNPAMPQTLTARELREHYGLRETFAVRRFCLLPGLREYDGALRAAIHALGQRPDLVFCRNIPAAAITARMGLPTMAELHQPFLGSATLKSLLGARGLRKVVFITEALRREVCGHFGAMLPREKTLLLPDAVDLERFEGLPSPPEARKRLGLGETPQAVGYVGHLYPGRGIDEVLALAERFPDRPFFVVGGNDADIARYSDTARGKNLSNVKFLGFVPNARLPQYLAACDVLLMPYQRKIAGSGGGDIARWLSPMKMFEYMASRRLIVATEIPVFREILNESNAVLCAPQDLDAFADAIGRAEAEPQWSAKLAAAARKDVEQYTWLNRARKILQAARG